MKSRFCLFAVLAVFLFAGLAQAASFTTVEKINVLAAPAIGSPQVGSIEQGTVIEVNGL